MSKQQSPTLTSDATFDRSQWLNLADSTLGATAIEVTDDFFADVNRMLSPTEPLWDADLYDDNGKWMDGWESRRKREPGHDHAVIRLATAGQIAAIDIDTRYFTGNYPPAASVEACYVGDGDPDSQTQWTEILPQVDLAPDASHLYQIATTTADTPIWTHLRLHIYPDGGIARLRVYGTAFKDWDAQPKDELIDLAALLNGGLALSCSDAHYGNPNHMMKPGKSPFMGDGWETARRRGPGHDWAIIQLGHPGSIESVLVDTQHFKGNYPHTCSIEAAWLQADQAIDSESIEWQTLLPEQHLSMDNEHHYQDELQSVGVISHIRLNIFPDGGVSRLRVMGYRGDTKQ